MTAPTPTMYKPVAVGYTTRLLNYPPYAYPLFKHRFLEVDENDNLAVATPWGMQYVELNLGVSVQRAAGISSLFQIIGDFDARITYSKDTWYTDTGQTLPGGDDYEYNLFGFAVSKYDTNLLSYDYPDTEEEYFDSDQGGGWPFIGLGYAEGLESDSGWVSCLGSGDPDPGPGSNDTWEYSSAVDWDGTEFSCTEDPPSQYQSFELSNPYPYSVGDYIKSSYTSLKIIGTKVGANGRVRGYNTSYSLQFDTDWGGSDYESGGAIDISSYGAIATLEIYGFETVTGIDAFDPAAETPGGNGVFSADNEELWDITISPEDGNYTLPDNGQFRLRRAGSAIFASWWDGSEWVWYDTDGNDQGEYEFAATYADPMTFHIFFQTMYEGQMSIKIRDIMFDYYDGIICPNGTVRFT
jgi:hypothetical protein